MIEMIRLRQKRKKFGIIRSVRELEQCMTILPEGNVVYKFVTNGGFSSISFIKYIADRCHVNELYASSFRIGSKELRLIDRLFQDGVIGTCHFAVGTLMANDSQSVKRYRYYDNFKELCERNGWEYIVTNNHSKILLFDTDAGKFVIETSSNLNDNPKIEQFSVEKSDDLFYFYRSVFQKWGKT